ncbi:MAG: aliphatic sulfonate ABC transporter substrate-binding protein [Nostoc sp. DedQUE08]|uniref:aliphatic sulfonate ABC transporter substrate-binding protein n=1 Tax=unclassified Nostoc TaxID=2593658 RepID=UPI002AD3F89F|nr:MULTISPECIES: aliphatic sulfonate ABC transporter substrate-binding protein [unclassified Nostoc]MDZ8032396.1 aliphatic sulfonate ABC transporter substrate-binding protein [Nostoc sp. DedSLP04]MDZ8064193.1 aliphatic sulfonate ABC transporter substrate-binding protein [Nostoc sp. DedQUE08]MDZ8090880.1 aliphatic sulfonate ABC transporter substrate-binding protein [Nostoc sp. DedQUE05]MDZ8127664.1 aliphatic sulfonate ABC transporter substrate-binding protein [Nostoc sp. DedQUE07]MDZ8134492.1 a
MNKSFQPQRRTVLKRVVQYSALGLFTLLSPLAGSLIQTTQAVPAKVINLAYQSSGDIVKSKKAVEPRFKALGITVNWVGPFAAGPQLIKALNEGKVDIGNVGETPPIFDQAARPGLIPEVVYLTGRTPSDGTNQGIVVKANSPIKKVADLKGKKIAFQVGSNAQYLLTKALKEVGLKISDIQIVALTPTEARDAFIQGKADAWVGGDPLLAAVESTTPIRNLRNAKGINTLGGFYIGRRAFVTQNPQLVRVFLEEAQKVGEAAEKKPSDYAKILVDEQKLDPAVALKVASRRTYKLRKITPAIVAEQQRVADFYFDEKVISRKIDIKQGILSDLEYKASIPDNIK